MNIINKHLYAGSIMLENEKWHDDHIPDRNGWTEICLILPFGVDYARIIFEE